MVNKRFIGTIATVALGLSLVGAANANTLDNLNLMPKTEEKTKNNNVRMKPNISNRSEIWKAMDEFHQGNYENMIEMHENMSKLHESMPHNA